MNQSSADRQIFHELSDINTHVRIDHKLPPEDKRILLELSASPKLMHTEAAILCLADAVHLNLFPLDQLLAIIEKKAKSGLEAWVTWPVYDYYDALVKIEPGAGGVGAQTRRTYAGILKKKKSRQKIDPEEKTFIEKTFSDQRPIDQQQAVWLLFLKKGLDKESLSWARRVLESQGRKSSKELKSFWSFALRIVTYRNRRR